MALQLWDWLDFDSFWAARLPPSRKGTCWLNVLKTLVCYRLLSPGSEWRLHRKGFDDSAMADLLGETFAVAAKNTLYRCHDIDDQLGRGTITRDRLLMKLGAAKKDAGGLYSVMEVQVPKADEKLTGFRWRLKRDKLRTVWLREGRYLLRTNQLDADEVDLWEQYIGPVRKPPAIRPLMFKIPSNGERWVSIRTFRRTAAGWSLPPIEAAWRRCMMWSSDERHFPRRPQTAT